jgi:hypothetical protein
MLTIQLSLIKTFRGSQDGLKGDGPTREGGKTMVNRELAGLGCRRGVGRGGVGSVTLLYSNFGAILIMYGKFHRSGIT